MSLFIQTYDTAASFLADTETWLLERELENNFILGIAGALRNSKPPFPEMHFVNCSVQGTIRLSALVRNSKIVITGQHWDEECVLALKRHYDSCAIKPIGVMGKMDLARSFSKHFQIAPEPERILILHELQQVTGLQLAPGELRLATRSDLDLIARWFFRFFEEVNPIPPRSEAEARTEASKRIANNDLYLWIKDGEVMSMAGVVRKSKHIAFLGLVYTPEEFRGNGYARSCVQVLSTDLLTAGYRSCGLFTEKSNPVSNRIYQQIGYVSSLEFEDIPFL
jgi:predicted GNAT family acetyltransferase